MLCLIILCLHLSCYFLDADAKVTPRPVYVSLGGCVNITHNISGDGSTIKASIISGKEILNLHDINLTTKFTVPQMVLLKYLHSFDALWVVLCDIYPRSEGISIRFTVTNGSGTNDYDSGRIISDYCTKSQRCNPWYLPMNGDGMYLHEKLEFDIRTGMPYLFFKKDINPLKDNLNLNFGVCSYSDCIFIRDFRRSEPHFDYKESQFQLKGRYTYFQIYNHACTQNNNYVFFVFYLSNKINIIRTRLIVSDILIPKPVYKSDSLVFNVINADIEKIKLEGKIFYKDYIFNINKTEYTYPSTMTVQLDPKGTYAAIWLEFYVVTTTSKGKDIPIYMNIYIDLETGIFATDKETDLPLNLPDLPKCRNIGKKRRTRKKARN